MTGWIIFGCILLVLILILVQSVTITGIYDKNPELRIKILCFTLVRVPPDPEQQKKKAAKKAAKEEKKARKEAAKAWKNRPAYNKALLAEAEKDETAESGQSAESTAPLPEKKADGKAESAGTAHKVGKIKKPKIKGGGIDFDMIMDYIRSASPPVKRLFKKIRIRDVYIDWVVGSDDAAKTALKYGGICAAVYSTAEFIKSYFRTAIKEINIEADFSAEKDDIFAYAVLKLRISTALGCALWLAFRMLRTYLKYNGDTKTKAKAKPRPVRAK